MKNKLEKSEMVFNLGITQSQIQNVDNVKPFILVQNVDNAKPFILVKQKNTTKIK